MVVAAAPAAHAEPVDVGLAVAVGVAGQGLRRLQERLAGRRRFEAEFGAEVLAPLPTAALLGRAVLFIREIMRDNQGLIRTTFRKSLDDPEAWAPVRAFGRAYQARIAELLASRAGDLGRDDWQDGFRFGMQMIYATLFNAIVNRPGPLAIEDQAMVDELTRMLTGYLQVRG